jgi:DNA-binding CsgD family transcriptional regulator/tetratricopeptide (TPR) repeat protein
VARAHELEQLTAALESATVRQGSTVLVSGEAGIGKTRLLSEFADRARGEGAVVLTGRCIDLVGAGLPYLPLVEALRPLRERLVVDDLALALRELPRLLPELAPGHAGAGGDEKSQLRLFEETVAVLEQVAASAPVVLVLEDLHWADESTIDLVAFLAHAVRASRILTVATYRSDELRPDDPRRRPLDELLRARAAVELALAPLTADELGALLADTAVDELTPDLAATIHARSEGNPFFAEELLAAARRGEEALPSVLRDVLLRRVARLGPDARSVLRAAAAAGRDVTFGLLAAVTPLDEERLVEALRQAVDGDVLAADQPASLFRFRHALLAEAVYGTLLPGEREDLHRRLATALAQQPGLAASRSAAGELALHWFGARRPVEALAASIEAAREAEEVSGRAEARGHVERALELWGQVADPGAAAGVRLGDLLTWGADLADLTGDAARAVELARKALDEGSAGAEQGAEALLTERLGNYLMHLGEHEDGRAALRRAAALVPREPPSVERVRILGSLGYALLPDHLAESIEVGEEALAAARVLGDDRVALRALGVLGMAVFYDGRVDEGIGYLRDAMRLAERSGAEADLTRTAIGLCDALIAAGLLRDAARTAVEGLAAARRLGLERGHGVALAVNAAAALIGLGDWTRAEAVLAPALHAGTPFWAHYPHMFQAQIDTARGRFDAAREHLEHAAVAASRPWAALEYGCLVAELALWEGRLDEAAGAVDEALRSSSGRDLAPHRARLTALGVRAEAERAGLADAMRDAATASAARRTAARLLAVTRDVAAAAVALPDVGAWLLVAEAEHSRAEGRSSPEVWQAGVEAWDRADRPYVAAYCRWRLSEALLASGAHSADAALPARESYRVAAWLGAGPLQRELELLAQRARLDLVGLPTEERAVGGENTLGLTARELDVIRLLGRGYTNREIAAELVISTKTASVHVSNILRKLDASNRLEAATIAQRLAPHA